MVQQNVGYAERGRAIRVVLGVPRGCRPWWAGCLPVIARNSTTRNCTTKSRCARHVLQVRKDMVRVALTVQTKNRGAGQRHFPECANGCTDASAETQTAYRSVASARTASSLLHKPRCDLSSSIAGVSSATWKVEALVNCHLTCSALKELGCAHRTFTLGSTD